MQDRPGQEDPEADRLLWELSDMDVSVPEGAPPRPPIADTTLSAWRDGRLPETDSGRVEELLIASTSDRRRLERLAGIRIVAPASVRRRLFGRLPLLLAPGAGRRQAFLLAGAAAAAIVIAVGLFAWRPGIERGPLVESGRLPEYQVTLSGLATVRSAPGGSSAFPETQVEITLLPETAPGAPVEFGFYRRAGEAALERVPEVEIRATGVNRGAATFRIAARDLVGDAAGTRSFHVVAAEAGRLPREVPVGVDSSATEALRALTGGRVQELAITIVTEGRDPQ